MKAISTTAALLLSTAVSAGPIEFEFDLINNGAAGPNNTSNWMVGSVYTDQSTNCILSSESTSTSYSQSINRRGPEGIQFVSEELRAIRGYSELDATISSGGTSHRGHKEAIDSVKLSDMTTEQIVLEALNGNPIIVEGNSPRGTVVTDRYDTQDFAAAHNLYEECLFGVAQGLIEEPILIYTSTEVMIGKQDYLSGLENSPLFLGMHNAEEQAWKLKEVSYRLDARLPEEGEEIRARFDMPEKPYQPSAEQITSCPAQNISGTFADISYALPGDHRGEVAYTTTGFVPLDAKAHINIDTLNALQDDDQILRGQSQNLIMDGKALKVDVSSNPDHVTTFNNGATGYAWGTVQVSPSTQQDPSATRTQDGCAQGDKILACVSFSPSTISIAPPEECSAKFHPMKAETPRPLAEDFYVANNDRLWGGHHNHNYIPYGTLRVPVSVDGPPTLGISLLGLAVLIGLRQRQNKKAKNTADGSPQVKV